MRSRIGLTLAAAVITSSSVATITATVIASGGVATVAAAQSAPKAAGHWEGKVVMRQQEIPIVVDLAKNAAGAWIGSIAVPGANAIDVPLSAIRVADNGVQFSATLPTLASFDATFSPNADSLVGNASNDDGSVPFRLARAGEPNVKLPPASSALTKDFDGVWEGSVESGGKVVHLTLTFSAAADGLAKASLVLVDQGGLAIPSSSVSIKDKDVSVEMRAVSAAYHGSLNAAGELVGEWSEAAKRMPLTFRRVAPKP